MPTVTASLWPLCGLYPFCHFSIHVLVNFHFRYFNYFSRRLLQELCMETCQVSQWARGKSGIWHSAVTLGAWNLTHSGSLIFLWNIVAGLVAKLILSADIFQSTIQYKMLYSFSRSVSFQHRDIMLLFCGGKWHHMLIVKTDICFLSAKVGGWMNLTFWALVN